jgi:hypothetical protein
VEGAVGAGEGDGAVGLEGEGPAAFVDLVVVDGTQRRLSHELVASEAT